MRHTLTEIIREFYSTVAFLLRYDCCEETAKTEEGIIDLLCRIHGCQEEKEDAWYLIEEARCLQLCTDEGLMRTVMSSQGTVLAMKLEALQLNRIERTRPFDPNTFIKELKETADLGSKNACKLLACLYWLGILIPENKGVAVKIWSALAVNGDWEAMETLIFAYEEGGNLKEANKWQSIFTILQTEYESFSSVALQSRYRDYSEEEVQLANLIMFIRQNNAKKDETLIDRAMLHYVLESKDDYEYKMERLASDTNYYLLMKREDMYSDKKFGF